MAQKGKARVLRREQLEMLWDELNYPHNVICQLCYYTASRINEVVSLRASDIRSDRILINVSKEKNGQQRTKEILMGPSLREVLKHPSLPTDGYLFPAAKWTRAKVKRYRIDRKTKPDRISEKTGELVRNHFVEVAELPPRQHLCTDAVYKAIRKAIALLPNLECIDGVSSHSFRRSFCTHQHQAGVPSKKVMKVSGHLTLKSFEEYIDIGEQEAREWMLMI